MDDKDRAWHDTMRPTWGPGGTLIFSATPYGSAFGRSGRITEKNGLMTIMKGAVVSATQDIRIAKFGNEVSSSTSVEECRIRLLTHVLFVQMSARAINTHFKLAQIHVVNGIPAVELKPRLSIKDFFTTSGTKNSADEHERLVWELASVLFDNVKVPVEIQAEPDALEKLRKENLSRLWESMVEERTNKAVTMAHSHEEKALAALSGHRTAEACKHLIEGKDFRLATLVSLIGTSDAMKKDMREQLREWRDANALSEFSQSIRALYEMLSGNVCTCEGTKGAPENRAESFSISEKFGLNWQQAFGMRLWYATSTNGSIAEAVGKYQADVAQDKELPPVVWFVQHGIPAIWDDPRKEDREDLLWGLLKLYADNRTDLESVLRPENSQLSPLDYRLCWQLGQALTSTGRVSFGKNATEKADAATVSFAAQLTNEGSWLEAVFVLLHLSNPDARAKAVQDHLCRHASQIGNDDSVAFRKLAGDFQIPTQWIWHAKALYMRSAKKDATAEVQCLLRAESWAEAHQAFIKEVAPKTIIERDYDGLADILQQFEGRHSHVPSWNVGGEIYKAFLQLLGYHRRSEEPPRALVNSLLEGLPAMHGNTPEAGVVEYAALTEMAAEVANVVASMARVGEVRHSHSVLKPNSTALTVYPRSTTIESSTSHSRRMFF
jgi:nuclear pore complex protein Nup98-Nup96